MKIPFGRFDRKIHTDDRSSEVLNIALYRRLCSIFGSVTLVHTGEKMIAKTIEQIGSGRVKLLFKQRGESYRVCCPFCSDTRSRLYISYQYGQRDSSGRFMFFLAYCFNEDCLSDFENQFTLRDMLSRVGCPLTEVKVREGKVRDRNRTFTMPGTCIRLSSLRKGHEARAYLSSRFLSADRLSRIWGVSFCSRYSDPNRRFVENRIVIPIVFDGKLAGWQSRYPGDLDWHGKHKKLLKYFTCPGMYRDLVICNWDMAKHYRTVVITEGWFDVFSTGPQAVCTLGVGMSLPQTRRIIGHVKKTGAVIVLMYDADVRTNPKLRNQYLRLVDRLSLAIPSHFVNVKLPIGVDPGSLDRSVTRAIAEEQAAKKGIQLHWDKFSEEDDREV